MNNSSPWWASGLFTVVGAVISTLATTVLAVRNRRTERRRLAWQQKVETYPELLHATSRLIRLPVWPVAAGDPGGLRDEIDRTVQLVRLFAPRTVLATLTDLLAAAESLADTIERIRGGSKPAHGDLVDQRDVPAYQAAVKQLETASEGFLTATRMDLEVERR